MQFRIFFCLIQGTNGENETDRMRPLQNSPKSPKFPPRHLGDFS
ncbi:hypothetical protein NEIMUCOT_06205 [Neisseria mucosa ATCC 25996]|uniref:Uncharacterized protein n=1 Tax=Neisseria mucosa (strain ATCC 25996 / DSM 4631 / NCTC 10774 / M26) TaxID=546266 RepID=D2ZZX1_NEIM2|nr:hypothetical protein NEIMUCOT_06205 [Neisseria mucosa ATCC 25996]